MHPRLPVRPPKHPIRFSIAVNSRPRRIEGQQPVDRFGFDTRGFRQALGRSAVAHVRALQAA